MTELTNADNYALAVAFIAAMRLEIEPADLKTIDERNAEETDGHICHSHDFCDANMVMLDAFKATFGREPAFLTCDDDATQAHYAQAFRDESVWGAAWTIAKRLGFAE